VNDSIEKPLARVFRKYRIVFWYDADRELRKDFEVLAIDGVEKLEISGNEFKIKHHVLRQEPDTQFLIYKEGPEPPDTENWLLDVQLASGEFRTDQASIYLAELGLGHEFTDIVRDHPDFFSLKRRRDGLRKLVAADDTPSKVRLKMLAVCARSDTRLDSVLENLLAEYAAGKSECWGDVERSNLSGFLWEQVNKVYGYTSDNLGLLDFVLELFKSSYSRATDGVPTLNAESLVFLKRWKDSKPHETTFDALSRDVAHKLSIDIDIHQRDYRDLLDVDYFESVDRKIISDLIDHVRKRTISAGECTQQIRERRGGHWFAKFSDIYDAIDYAAQFFQAVGEANVECESLKQAVQSYTQSHFRVDQLYRKFIYFYRKSREVTALEQLANDVLNHYTNTFLRQLGDNWQQLVDEMSEWTIPNVDSQSQFFKSSVGKFLRKNNKVYVIISDALRYECADELVSVIRQEDRFEAELGFAVTSLPSYTQLGMAALLPHRQLQINNDKTATVTVDGKSSQGTAQRDELLKSADNIRSALAIQAEDILGKNTVACRELVRDHDLIYIYQNRIDKTGHSRDSEKDAFHAVEEALDEIVKITKKLASANASNILITADHGFIYQDEVVEESDFSVAEPQGDIFFKDRRFVLGRNLTEVDGVKKFTSQQLGLAGDVEVVIPKSINRFRKKGSSTRFIHGGCTLQEIVVPVIEVHKSRKSDISQVEVDRLPSSSSVISSGQLGVVFYQVEPVTDKLQARRLRVGIYASNGELLSDRHELNCDLTSANPRERELKVRLILSKQADDFNNQQVMLKLEEQIPGTSHHQDYKSFAYTIRRSFTSDFDF
jgi:uncharacterized protein (TIGR02687 family)